MVKSSRSILLTFLLAIAALPLSAKTWYVRPDGGTRYSAKAPTGQCDGVTDARYPGSGVNRHCAYKDVRYLWDDGTLGNWGWVISGGDAVIIKGCAASAGQKNPDAPHCRIGYDNNAGNSTTNPWCWYAPGGYGSNFGCYNPPIPAGTSAAHTRILGACAVTGTCNSGNTTIRGNLTQLFGGFGDQGVLNLTETKYVDVEGLEITTHNGKCVQYGVPAYPRTCSNNIPGADDYANNGILTDATTGHILLQDIYVHGFTASGLSGPIGGPIALIRVFVGFNGFAGWNFDNSSHAPDAAGSSITASYVTMQGNGCDEQYPIVNSEFPAFACYDSSSGGFGDSWSGQDTTLDSFICDHCQQIYNTKDGFIGPHTLIGNLKITNSESYGNMGQQWKWGASPGSTTIFENNLTVGNCSRMAEPLPGAPQGYNRHLSNFCRAAGDVFSFFSAANSTVRFANNTVVAYSATVFDPSCVPAGACGSTPFTFTNNIFLGYYLKGAEPPGLFYTADRSIKITASHDIEFGNRSGAGSSCRGDVVCSDPRLINQPSQQGWTNQTMLDNFNFHPASGSPAIGHGIAVTGIATDYYCIARPNPPSIGAVEPGR
jgi:hypothetical protein